MRIDAFKRRRIIISWRIQAVHEEAESNTQSEERCAMRATREAAKPSKEAALAYVCMQLEETRNRGETGDDGSETGDEG